MNIMIIIDLNNASRDSIFVAVNAAGSGVTFPKAFKTGSTPC
jgi:hypothetical protein